MSGRYVTDEAVSLAASQGELSMPRFISNPDASELDGLIPRLGDAPLRSLDVSYCLELRRPMVLLSALRTHPANDAFLFNCIPLMTSLL